jgi:hypothetical protein
MYYHAVAEAVLAGGLSVISAANAWAGTADITKRRICDYRLAALADFSTAELDHHIQFDRGAAAVSELQHLIIPAGHNYNGENIQIDTDALIDFSSGSTTTILAETAITSAALIDLAVTGSGTPAREKQFVRLTWPNSTSTAWETPELWLGEKETTTTGIAHAWSNPLETPMEEQPFSTRDAAIILGPARRTWELTHVHLDATDMAIYDEIADTGRTLPFWFWPPDDAYTEPLLMKLTEDMEREQDSTVPKTEVTYTVRLRMREQTT